MVYHNIHIEVSSWAQYNSESNKIDLISMLVNDFKYNFLFVIRHTNDKLFYCLGEYA